MAQLHEYVELNASVFRCVDSRWLANKTREKHALRHSESLLPDPSVIRVWILYKKEAIKQLSTRKPEAVH
jgi:hypothetical protein